MPARERAGFRRDWEAAVRADAEALKDALEALLSDSFSGHQGKTPILLVIDDLERILEAPQAGQSATLFTSPEAGAVIAAIIAAFRGWC